MTREEMMQNQHTVTAMTVALFLLPFASSSAQAEEANAWTVNEAVRFDVGLSFSRFEQQIKTEVGGERGELLVTDSELNLVTMGAWNFWGPLSVGAFAQFDVGSRTAGRFAGFDTNNRTQIEGEVGGGYWELWIGPLLRGHWRFLFAELGYGAVGLRSDDGRDDLPASDGDTDGLLRTSRSVAFVAAVGANFPVWKTVHAVFRLEYRVRYYDRRDDELADEVVHGTQNYTPFVGVAF